MKKMSQQSLMDTKLLMSIEREELLVKKYEEYDGQLDNKELKQMIKKFKKTSKEHLGLVKDLMIKLNLER